VRGIAFYAGCLDGDPVASDPDPWPARAVARVKDPLPRSQQMAELISGAGEQQQMKKV